MKKFEVIMTVGFRNADVFGEGTAFGENAIEMKREIAFALDEWDISLLNIKAKKVLKRRVKG